MQMVFSLTAAITLLVYYVFTGRPEVAKNRGRALLAISIIVPLLVLLPSIFY